MKFSKFILIAITIGFCVYGARVLFKKDSYIGFYYPDKNNLTYDITSYVQFDSIGECRLWIKDQVSIYNKDGEGYDYECGKNCDLSGDKPYVCEATLE